jgi:1-aminocyclopropane-1-carboxylate deaminase
MQLQLPSPVQQIHLPLFQRKGLEVFVKRDDLIHPLVSGNKWRKLKYILLKAKSENKNHLVTFGGAFSNHLLATAATAQAYGLKASAVVRGEKVANHVLSQCKKLGMQLFFTDRESYRDKPALFQKYFFGDEHAFFIDEGGASPQALPGCAEMLDELNQSFDHIFCAAGTGTTAAGIYTGMKNKGMDSQLHIVPVLKHGEFIQTEIAKYLPIDAQLSLHTSFHFGGYAKVNDELLRFIIFYYRHTGILLDPVYTGKMVFALHQLAENDLFKPGSKILWIHSGGLQGLLGMQVKFELIDPDFTQNFTRILSE